MFCTLVAGNAYGQTRRTAIVATLSEMALASAALIQDGMEDEISELVFDSQYSDGNWSVSAEGSIGDQEIELEITGHVRGGNREDLSLNYSGGGTIGREPVRIEGQAEWLYDAELLDYPTMKIEHAIQIGEDSFWGWIVGSEIVVGGAVGGGAAIVASPATGGGSLLIGAGAAIAGAEAMVLLSRSVREIVRVDSSEPPPQPPEAPATPEAPRVNEPIPLERDTILVAVERNGEIIGRGPDTNMQLLGRYDHGDRFYRASIVIN